MTTQLDGRPRLEWWPVSIMAFFGVAIAGAVAFVVFCNLHPTDLVAQDYYERELKYQDHLDRLERTRGLGAAAGVAYDAVARQIIVRLPEAQTAEGITGQIHLYRPAAAGMDKHLRLSVEADGRQTIDATSLEPGLWKVKVLWRAGGKDYGMEEPLVLGGTKPS